MWTWRTLMFVVIIRVLYFTILTEAACTLNKAIASFEYVEFCSRQRKKNINFRHGGHL